MIITNQTSSIPITSDNSSLVYKILSVINIIFGAIQIILSGIFIIDILPKVTDIYAYSNVVPTLVQMRIHVSYVLLFILLSLGFVNLFIGIKLFIKPYLSNKPFFIVSLVMLVLSFFLTSGILVYVLTITVEQIYKIPFNSKNHQRPVTVMNSINQKSKWEVYTNTKYKYSIDYPPNLNLYVYDNAPSFLTNKNNTHSGAIIINNIIESSQPKDSNNIPLSFETYVDSEGIMQYAGYFSLHNIKSIFTNTNVKGFQTTWNTKPSIVMSSTSGTEVSYPITYFPYTETNIYGAIAIQLIDKNYSNTYQKMIKSFTYLK